MDVFIILQLTRSVLLRKRFVGSFPKSYLRFSVNGSLQETQQIGCFDKIKIPRAKSHILKYPCLILQNIFSCIFYVTSPNLQHDILKSQLLHILTVLQKGPTDVLKMLCSDVRRLTFLTSILNISYKCISATLFSIAFHQMCA